MYHICFVFHCLVCLFVCFVCLFVCLFFWGEVVCGRLLVGFFVVVFFFCVGGSLLNKSNK